MTNKDLECLLELKLMIESPVSIYTLTNRFREHGLIHYLKTLDDDELDVAYQLVRREEITDETNKMLILIDREKEIRHYTRVVGELTESKTM